MLKRGKTLEERNSREVRGIRRWKRASENQQVEAKVRRRESVRACDGSCYQPEGLHISEFEQPISDRLVSENRSSI